jgi:glycosyltransferase involved in cell wall biosynthesis
VNIDCIIPARDEALTVADNVVAALGCRYVREVIVVDDGSIDGTADVARESGAKVIAREASCGSKAHAMDEGVAVSDAHAVLFVDADCVGLTPEHLDAICEPLVEGRAVLSLGAFDYGRFWNPLVLRWPPLTGERIVPRWVWEAIPPQKLDGYTIEMRINEVVAERRLPTVARTMPGVRHRTKRDKHGRREGVRRTLDMYRDLVATIWPFGDVRVRTYWFYLRALTVER